MTRFSKKAVDFEKVNLVFSNLSNITTSGSGLMLESLLIESHMLFKSTTIIFFFFVKAERKTACNFRNRKKLHELATMLFSVHILLHLFYVYFIFCCISLSTLLSVEDREQDAMQNTLFMHSYLY